MQIEHAHRSTMNTVYINNIKCVSSKRTIVVDIQVYKIMIIENIDKRLQVFGEFHRSERCDDNTGAPIKAIETSDRINSLV